MVVVASVALAIMISNDLIVPTLLRNQNMRAWIEAHDLGALILFVRRISILLLLVLAYGYFRFAGDAQLVQMGLLSFAAIAQTLERLRMLLVLTVCDTRAVGPGVWNGWTGQLLRTL